jgi:predicted ribosomally synthesized peptide with SipW-like signal peptide
MAEKFELSRRKVLAGLGTVGVASAGVGLGTSAYFSDKESFENNQLVAGELDLKVGWEEHYSDWSDDESDGLEGDVQMEQGDDFTAGSTVNSTRVGLPANAAAMISLEDAADAKQVLDNTEEDVYPTDYDSDDFMTGTAITCGETLLADDDTDKPVIELDDVKPGDFGEVTFSFALCDNPGYVWAQAFLESASENGVNEPEGKDPDEEEGVVELLDEIQVAVWLDDGNNYQNCGEQPLVVDSLRNIINDIPNPGLRLDGRSVALADASPTDFTAFGVNRFDTGEDGSYDVDVELAEDPDGSGKVAHTTSGGVSTNDFASTAVCLEDPPTLGDLTDSESPTTLTYEYYQGPENTNVAPDGVWLLIEEGTNGPYSEGTQHAVRRTSDDQSPAAGNTARSAEMWHTRRVHKEIAGDPDFNPGYNWFDESFGGNNIGNGGDTSDLSDYFGDDAEVLAMAANLGSGGGAVNDVYYRNPELDGSPVGPFPTSCFRGEGTVYNGVFAWWLPVDHANEIQTDSAEFSLGLYTEQCRHNDGSGMPPE